MTEQKRTKTEEFHLSGEEILAKAKELIKEGNARQLILKNEEGRVVLSIPLSAGVGAGVLMAIAAPAVAVIGAVAAFMTKCTLVVERDTD